MVYGLAAAGNVVYLAASNEFFPGLCATVYAFDVRTRCFRTVIDVRAATGFVPESGRMPHSKIHLCLEADAAGRAFACTHFTAPAIGQKDFEPIHAYREAYEGCVFLEYDPASDRTINHGRLLRGEGARISCLDPVRRQYYFLSYPRNHLYRYDYARRTLHDLGRPGQENAFGLGVDDDGNVFTSDDLGRILVYSFSRDRLEATDLHVPLAPGRRPNGNYIRRMARGLDGCFYGFGNKGVRLFRLDPRARELEDLGVIHGREVRDASGYPKLPPAKAVVATDPQTLLVAFGGDSIYVDDVPVPNLVRYDLATRTATELGKFADPVDGLPAWIPQCAVHLPQHGATFFGLQQTVGRLRLWQVDAGPPTPPQPRPGPAPSSDHYRDHLAVITRQPFGASVEGANALPYVRSGHVRMHELGWPGEDATLPAGESAIASLVFVGDTLYGATTGRRGHLFSYRPYQQNRFTENYEVHPWDLGSPATGPIEHAALFADAARGRLLVLSRGPAGAALHAYPPGLERRRYRGVYHSLPHWPPVAWEASPFTELWRSAPDERVHDATWLDGADTLVWTTPGSELGWTTLGEGALTRRSAFAPNAALVVALGGRRFAALGPEQSGCFEIDAQGRLVETGPLPRRAAPATRAVYDHGSQTLAVGGADGTLDLIGVGTSAVNESVALPHPWPVRALAWHPAGWVYGFQGEAAAIGEAFAVHVPTRTVRAIGILQAATQPRYWIAHTCGAATTGPRGEVYFGEDDQPGHLFTYLPTETPLA